MKNANFAVKSLLTLGALFAFAAPTFAQAPAPTAPATPVVKGAKGAKHAAHLPKWLADVTLTADQTEKVHAILKTSAAETKAAKEDTALTAEAKAAKLKEIKKDNRTQIMALLTPEQQAQVKAAKKGPAPVAPTPATPKN